MNTMKKLKWKLFSYTTIIKSWLLYVRKNRLIKILLELVLGEEVRRELPRRRLWNYIGRLIQNRLMEYMPKSLNVNIYIKKGG